MTAKVTIKVDYRERDFTTLLRQRLSLTSSNEHIKLEDPANLDIGDILVCVAGYGEFIIERKRIDDMTSSIKDGRYAEQKTRCLSYIAGGAQAGICRVLIYLVEGDMSLCRTDADYNLVQGSWISMALRDKLPVIRVMTTDEGVRWLIRLCERCISKPKELFPVITAPKSLVSNPPDPHIKTIILGGASNIEDPDPIQQQENTSNIKQVSQAEYLATVKTKKKENITPATCAPVMLSVIPGMTTASAQVVLDTIGGGGLAGLIRALTIPNLEGQPELDRVKLIKDKKKVLADICIKPGRKLGPALADKVWDYLFNL